jgi:hypothetical protein
MMPDTPATMISRSKAFSALPGRIGLLMYATMALMVLDILVIDSSLFNLLIGLMAFLAAAALARTKTIPRSARWHGLVSAWLIWSWLSKAAIKIPSRLAPNQHFGVFYFTILMWTVSVPPATPGWRPAAITKASPALTYLTFFNCRTILSPALTILSSK